MRPIVPNTRKPMGKVIDITDRLKKKAKPKSAVILKFEITYPTIYFTLDPFDSTDPSRQGQILNALNRQEDLEDT